MTAPASDSITVLGGSIDITVTIDPVPDELCGTLVLTVTLDDGSEYPSEFMELNDYTLTVTPTLQEQVDTYVLDLSVEPDNGDNPYSTSVQSTVDVLDCVIIDFGTDSGTPIDDISYVIEGTQIDIDI